MPDVTREEVIFLFREIGVNDDFADILMAEDEAYNKALEIFMSVGSDIDFFVKRMSATWDEILKETGYEPPR